ncbi:MAG: tRNA uridine-5-carboxymethylaminomethyl(34) synthesis GTPase MnmE [Oscillospiraceae bacterium]
MEHAESSTIVALSTPAASGALAVIRLSGPRAIELAQAVFSAKSGRPLAEMAGYTAAYGDFIAEGEPIDDGVVLLYHAPKSYTGEEMAELSCHGSMRIVSRLLGACVAAGARPAAAGEFTRRAFLNGKLDLASAEAVAELIAADSEGAARAALGRRRGALSEKVDAITDRLAFEGAQLAVWSDYPEEEDAPVVTAESLGAALRAAGAALQQLLDGYRVGALVQRGIAAAIVGSPNVGKSTLMNLLAGGECSIVTEIAGTTRDVVEAHTTLGGVALRLLDTAGIRDTEDRVERLGVERARAALAAADLVVLVLDRSRPLDSNDRALLASLKNRPHVVALNKTDLPSAILIPPEEEWVEISAATGEGAQALTDAIAARLGLNLTQDACLIASARQHDCLCRAAAALDAATAALETGITLDAVGVLLEDAVAPLAELTGRTASEAVLEQVFSKFCVGK